MLDKIIKFSIKNKVIVGIMTLLLIIWGVWSATKLPIDAVPDITNNQVQIITACPTLAGQEVEQLVTFPIEQSIANVPDIEETRSISRFGLSVITVVFKENVDVYFARQLINEQLKTAVEEIPKGVGTPELAPVSTGLGEVYQYILHPKKGSEKKYSAKELRTMQDWIVRRQLNGTPGVAEINSFGGELKQYEVGVNPDRLKAMGVSISDIFTALEKNNQNTGGAYIDKKPNAYFIRGIGFVTSLDDIRNISVKNETGSVPIFIKDVADVRLGSAVRYGALTYNGKVDAVGGVVMMLKGANSNDVVSLIKAKIPTIQKSLPDDVVIEPFLDRTDLVDRAINTVEKNLIEGALIVIFVLVVFLGNFRAGLIVASAIPLSLLFALGMMNVFGVSANLMSLGAIDFGLIVDGAVIIVEATLHVLQHNKNYKNSLTQIQMDQEVGTAASKMMNSAIFGQIIILIVYVPILTLVGVEGKMFTPMAKTVGFAIIGATILSITYIPAASALFLSKKITHKKTISDKMMDFLQKIYQPMLQKAVKVKYIIVSVTVFIFVISAFIFKNMGGEFIPQLQEGDYAFHCILPQGSSLSQSIETSMQASRIIKQFDEVKMVVGKTGSAEVPTDPMPPEATDLIVVLKPQSEWKSKKSYTELADEISEKLETIPGVFFEKNQPIQMRFNELMTGIRQDVAVKIFGENLDSLSIYADKVGKIIQTVDGATAPQIERVSGLPQINVEYDRTRMANYGLNIEDVNNAVSTAFAGKAAGQVFENERRFDLVVRLDSLHRTSISDVNNLMIATNTGAQIPLSQVANVSYKLGPAQISREEGKRRIVIGFNVKGRDVQSVVQDIQAKLDKQVKLPSGYYFTYGGQFENLQEASKRLMIAVPVSLFLIFMLLYFTFHSFKQAALIFTAIPMSAIGGVFALLLRDMPFSISAGIGFIALFGVAVLNGIVLIGTFNQLEKEGETDVLKRVYEGTKTRLRPVLMTATVASLGFLPMAISTGAGAEVQKPLATVVIGGLVTATFLTLFVLPMLYIIFNTKIKGRINKIKPVATILVLGFLMFGQTFKAQTRQISVDQAVEMATENNLVLKSKDLSIKSAEALKGTAKELPKLNFEAQLGQYNSPKFDQSFAISQSIPFPTLFKARRELITENIKSRQISKEVSVNELTKQVRSYYYQIEYLQYNKFKLKDLDSLYQDFIRIATVRFKAGDIKKIEINTAETQKGEISLLLRQNEVYLNNAYKNLKTLLNTSEDFEVPFKKEYEPLKTENILDSGSVANNPTIKAFYQEMEIAEKNKKVEKSQGLPEFSLGLTSQSLIGFHTKNGQEKFYNAGDRFNSFSVGVAIPLTFGATKARIQALEYDKLAAETNAKMQQKQLTAQLENALGQYQQDIQQYEYYVSQAIPNAEKIVKAAQLGYKTGEISYVEYLFALQTATNIQLKYLESIQQVNQSVVTINSIINK
ncbi:CusA/CzcA family heavy metal efflux RND transporter [Chryseobacterium angstadtii]|nr:CusA/CzcA family heavy metal efflux RND transporter [Chryseobacterium angstadtii]